ncbi:hypothetical protein [Hymenobacter segetis]
MPLEAFIPTGYEPFPFGRAVGDLNGDGRSDAALVLCLRNTAATAPRRPERVLVVLWGTATGYQLAARSTHAVLGRGGQDHETFRRVLIQRGTLVLDHYSASNWFWRIRTVFRCQTGTFIRIGETVESGRTGGDCDGVAGPAGWRYRDTNFVTGSQETWRISEACQVLEHRQFHAKPGPFQSLARYKPPVL